MLDKSNRSKRKLKIDSVSQNHANLVVDLMQSVNKDFSIEGYELWIDGTSAIHIEDRHGEKGVADSSMATDEAKMLIPWAAQNADSAEFIYDNEGNIELSKRFQNKDGSYAPQIKLKKQINGNTVHVSEVVADSENKRIWITSSYIEKGSNGQLLNMEENSSPQPTPKASPDSSATTNTIPQTSPQVNTENYPTVSRDGIEIKPESDPEIQERLSKAKDDIERTGILSGASEHTISLARRLEKLLGVKIRFELNPIGTHKNGRYNRVEDTIYVNMSENNDSVIQIISHEFMHSVEGTRLHAALFRFAEKMIDRKNGKGTFNNRAHETIKDYEKSGEALTLPQAQNEVVCNFIADNLLKDEETIKHFVREHRTLAERFQKLIDRVLSVFSNKATRAEAKTRLALEKANRLYKDAMETRKTGADLKTRVDELRQKYQNGEITEEEFDRAVDELSDEAKGIGLSIDDFFKGGGDSFSISKNPVAKSKRSMYNEYNTNGMQWAYNSSTDIGDIRTLYKPAAKKYALIKATKEDIGFIELSLGTLQELQEEMKNYERRRQQSSGLDTGETTSVGWSDDFEMRQGYESWHTVDAGDTRGRRRTNVVHGTGVSKEFIDRTESSSKISGDSNERINISDTDDTDSYSISTPVFTPEKVAKEVADKAESNIDIAERVKEAQRKSLRARAKANLTQAEERIVDSLVSGSLTLNEVSDEYNKADIKAIYEATLEYEKAKAEAEKNGIDVGKFTKANSADSFSISRIKGDSGKDYGIGVYLDSSLLTNLNENDRKEMVKERVVTELSGQTFIAYDNNGNSVNVKVANTNDKIQKSNGRKRAIIEELYRRNNANIIKQEAVVLSDELIQSSKFDSSASPKYSHDWLDNHGKNDWEYWKVYLQEKNKTVWEATLNIANTANGEKVLYDINPIRKVEGPVKSVPTTTDSSIPKTSQNVNSKNSHSISTPVFTPEKVAKEVVDKAESNIDIAERLPKKAHMRLREVEKKLCKDIAKVYGIRYDRISELKEAVRKLVNEYLTDGSIDEKNTLRGYFANFMKERFGMNKRRRFYSRKIDF